MGQEKGHLQHKLDVGQTLQECDFGGTPTGAPVSLPAGSKFTIVNSKGEDYIIKFWYWGGTKNLQSNIAKATAAAPIPGSMEFKLMNYNIKPKLSAAGVVIPNEYENRYFLISKVRLEIYGSELTPLLEPTYGIVVLPIKVRFKPSAEFSKDVTFAGNGGIKFNVVPSADFSISLLVGTGISAVTLDSSNVDVSTGLKESTERPAIAFYGGLVLQWKALQMGLFTGGDWLANNKVDKWNYHGKPWLGFGIGISIFSKADSGSGESKNGNPP